MNVKRANLLHQLLHAKKYHYKIWVTIEWSPIFGHVKKVTEDKLTFTEPAVGSIRIDKIVSVKPFYDNVSLDELDSEEQEA